MNSLIKSKTNHATTTTMMATNRDINHNTVHPTKSTRKNSYVSVARALMSRLPLKESKQKQARDAQGSSTSEPMDVVTQRETSTSTSPRPPYLVPDSPNKNNAPSNVSIEKLCFKLDLDLEEELDDIVDGDQLEDELFGSPMEDDFSNNNSRRRRRSRFCCGSGSAVVDDTDPMISNTNTNMAFQTAQIFRGVRMNEDGTVISENKRASRSNAGKKARKGKRSRQAANIHRAWDIIDGVISNDEEGKDGDTTKPSKVLSLVVVGEFDAMDDLILNAPRKLQKIESDLTRQIEEQEEPKEEPKEDSEEGPKEELMDISISPLNTAILDLPQLV